MDNGEWVSDVSGFSEDIDDSEGQFGFRHYGHKSKRWKGTHRALSLNKTYDLESCLLTKVNIKINAPCGGSPEVHERSFLRSALSGT